MTWMKAKRIGYNPRSMKQPLLCLHVIVLFVVTIGCTGQASRTLTSNTPTAALLPSSIVPVPTITIPPTDPPITQTAQQTYVQKFPTSPTATSTAIKPSPTYDPKIWSDLPIIPTISPRVKEIYARGHELGNSPNAFSKIGDCGSTPAWFLGDYDRGPRYYNLGEYQVLNNVIQAFQGSYDRISLAAKSGFNASSIFSPLWSNRELCQPNESPLACEYRVHKPSFAFIMLGTNDVWHQDSFEPQMRLIIETSIDLGIVPILSTKADNREGDGSVNATIARLANEYQMPLWNFWAAVQDLPDQGLQDDGSHLTWAPNQFNDPQVLEKAWPVRNLTALQVLNEIWNYVSSP